LIERAPDSIVVGQQAGRGAGYLFLSPDPKEPYRYDEVGLES
jgi:hypothetical protein